MMSSKWEIIYLIFLLFKTLESKVILIFRESLVLLRPEKIKKYFLSIHTLLPIVDEVVNHFIYPDYAICSI